MTTRRLVLLGLPSGLLALAACRRSGKAQPASVSSPPASQPPTVPAVPPLPVVASFSILADMVAAIGGPAVTVRALVGPGQDAHAFRPRPSEQRELAGARLLVRNGLGFEGWLDRMARAAGYRGPIVTATDGLVPRRPRRGGAPDPHAWQDLTLAPAYVRNILAGLIAADPAREALWRRGAADYLAAIAATDAWARAEIERVPRAERRIITSHDAFGYLGARYGITVLAAQGTTAEGGASAAAVASLIRRIRAERIRAVFVEAGLDRRQMESIAAETGARIGGALYADTLAPEGLASTYLGLFRHNIPLLVAAMQGR